MPDDNRTHDRHHGGKRAPGDWNAAFAAMPLERPDTDAWAGIAARLPTTRKHSPWIARVAIAAALALAVIVPLRMLGPAAPDAGGDGPAQVASTQPTPTQAPTPATDPLETLYAQSAQLEGLLALARDENVATGAALELNADLDAQLATIDAELRQPGLAADRQLALWRDRVDTLRSAVSFESTRRLLAANGERYDGALVQVY
jgi:hypothetical protein